MAVERKRIWGELAAVQMSWLALKLVGERIEPKDLNPYGVREKPTPKSEEQIKRESELAWKLLDRFFCGG